MLQRTNGTIVTFFRDVAEEVKEAGWGEAPPRTPRLHLRSRIILDLKLRRGVRGGCLTPPGFLDLSAS
jgi:hypothetical protein